MQAQEYEYRTVKITAAARCSGNNRFTRRRNQELADITNDGWEIVNIAPKPFGSIHDRVTARRPVEHATTAHATAATANKTIGRRGKSLVEQWNGYSTKTRVVIAVVGAVLVLSIVGNAFDRDNTTATAGGDTTEQQQQQRERPSVQHPALRAVSYPGGHITRIDGAEGSTLFMMTSLPNTTLSIDTARNLCYTAIDELGWDGPVKVRALDGRAIAVTSVTTADNRVCRGTPNRRTT